MEEEDNIEKFEIKLIDSVTSDKLAELSSDIGESVIDVMTDDGIVQNIPILGSIYKLGKIGVGIREQYFAKKIYMFLAGIKDVSTADRQKFITDLDDPKFGQRAGETLLTLIDRFDSTEKPMILSKLFKAKVNGDIDAENFLRLGSILDKSFIPDLHKLKDYEKSKLHSGHETESLESMGLIYQCVIDANGENNRYTLTSIGADMLKYGVQNNA